MFLKSKLNADFQNKLLILSVVVAALIFFADLSLPLGVAGGVPYVALILIGFWFEKKSHVFGLAVAGSVLTIFGFFLSPLGGIPWIVHTNRELALFTIWVLAILISKRLDDEERVRSSEEKFRDLFEQAGDAIYVSDPHTSKILDVNKTGCEQLGYERDEILGMALSEIETDWEPSEQRRRARDLLPGIHPTFESRHRHRDGHAIPVEVSVRILTTGGRNVFQTQVRDISERLRGEEAIRKRAKITELLHKTAQAANEAVSVEKALQSCIDDVCAYTGWKVGHVFLGTDETPSMLKSSGIWHLDDERRYENLRAVTERCIFAPGQGQPGQVLVSKKARWKKTGVGDSFAPRRDAIQASGLRNSLLSPVMVGTEVVAVLDFFTDQDMERDDQVLLALGQVGTQLGRVIERERASQRLLAAMIEANSANQAKSEFLSSMSHELRTPMNAILGFAQMLEFNPKEPLTDLQNESVAQIMKGGEHLLKLINNILNLARIEAGKLELAIEEVAPAEVLDESLSLVKSMADERNITLSVAGGKAEPRLLRVDRTRLIPAARQDELFKPFSRLGAEETAIEGTGIGLSVTKQLVEMMGGEIGFESKEGAGSTFWIVLPLARGESTRPAVE